MRILLVSLMVAATLVLAGVGGESGPGKDEPGLSIFITGNTLGYLKPCGCSDQQLGGLEKRPAAWKDVPRQNRLVIETGNLLDKADEQGIIKFAILMQALLQLDYDLVALSAADLKVAREQGFAVGMPFPVIAAPGAVSGPLDPPTLWSRAVEVGGRKVKINVAAFDAQSPMARLEGLLPERDPATEINVLIYNRHFEEIDLQFVRDCVLFDVMICLSGYDDARVLNESPLVITPGREGKYMGRLDVVPSDSGLRVAYRAIPLSEELASDPKQVQLYKDYQQVVKEANLLEKYPKLPLPNKLEYIGSRACRACHDHHYEYDMWSQKAHAHAYQTLVNVGSQHDPECIVCHVVGYKHETGYVSEKKNAHLKNVGCESCHGAGSYHLETMGKAKMPGLIDCTECHTVANSPKYHGREEEYREKIKHWKEPKEAGAVK